MVDFVNLGLLFLKIDVILVILGAFILVLTLNLIFTQNGSSCVTSCLKILGAV